MTRPVNKNILNYPRHKKEKRKKESAKEIDLDKIVLSEEKDKVHPKLKELLKRNE